MVKTNDLDRAYALIHEHEKQKQVASNEARKKQYVGKFFKTSNCYSGDHGRWWLYAHVTGIREYGHLQGWTFQRAKDNAHDDIEIESRTYMGAIESFTEITADEFWQAASEVRQECVRRLSREQPATINAVDPHACSTGKPSPREKGI